MKIWTRNTNNDVVRQYLLGNLPESAREKVERRVLNEAEASEEVQATEDELIDQYLGGKLNAQERNRFESYFLVPQERQRKLRFGKSLRRYLDSAPGIKSNQNVSKSGLVRFRWLEPRPVLVTSLVVLCLVALAALWLVSHKSAESGATGQTLAITLDPGSSRANGGSIQRIEVPGSYGSVEIQLEIGRNEYSVYQVELLRERRSLNIYKSLQAQNKDGRLVLVVVIPAKSLEPGDYVFKLSGVTSAGQIEYEDQYQLRVTPAH